MTDQLNGEWVRRLTRSLLDGFDGFLLKHSYLIHDRDPLFTTSFGALLRSCGVEPVKLPARSPNLNAYAERFVGSIRSECLGRMIIFGERRLRHIVSEYAEHYHHERSHQGLDNVLIDPIYNSGKGPVICDDRLGGLLRFYHRSAA